MNESATTIDAAAPALPRLRHATAELVARIRATIDRALARPAHGETSGEQRRRRLLAEARRGFDQARIGRIRPEPITDHDASLGPRIRVCQRRHTRDKLAVP